MSSGFYSNFSNKEPSSFIEQLILELAYCIFILYFFLKKKANPETKMWFGLTTYAMSCKSYNVFGYQLGFFLSVCCNLT